MTVKELIEKLQQLNPDLHVFVAGYEGGYDYAGVSEEVEIALDVHEEWYYGKHESVDIDHYVSDKSKYKIVKGIVL